MSDPTYDFNVTMSDVIAAGHCVAGAQRWATDNNLNWRDFLRGGIPAEVMLATGDAQGIEVVKRVARIRDGEK